VRPLRDRGAVVARPRPGSVLAEGRRGLYRAQPVTVTTLDGYSKAKLA
jgi:hypothetical protein